MADIRRKGKVVVIPGQPPKDAELMEVTKSDEKWSTYDLDDGAQIKLRSPVLEIWRVVNEYDPDGNPMYVVKGQSMMVVHAPDALKVGGKK